MNKRSSTIPQGSIIITTIVFMTVFSILFASLIDYLVTQHRWADINTERERALHIAESGIEYYRWHLAHYPNDLQDGTATSGPYVHVYEDPEYGPVGEFSLEVGGEMLCGQAQVVEVTSTAWTYKRPDITRSISVRIARPTVADFSYIVDSNVWAGPTRTIIGPYHSNGVVRMDGDNQSAVTSKVNSTSCAGAGLGGCSGTIRGVYGAGTHPEWWRWNQAEIPFTNFDYDFGQMQSLASTNGIYLPKISNDTSVYGYYLELQSDKTVDIYRVTSVSWITSETPNGQTVSFPEIIGNPNTRRQVVQMDVPIPQSCPLIYTSDRTWLEGTVSGKVTVVANDTGAATPDMFLQDNITYSTTTGADGLTALAERNLLIPLYVPNSMSISGVFFAQKGAYGRNYYECSGCTSVNPNDSYKTRSRLDTTGTVVSKLRTGTQWSDGQGFTTRNDFYDRNLVESPPPLTPFTSPDFRFIEWREVE